MHCMDDLWQICQVFMRAIRMQHHTALFFPLAVFGMCSLHGLLAVALKYVRLDIRCHLTAWSLC